LIVFFVVGAFLLTRVNVERGVESALRDEQTMVSTAS